MKVLVLGHTGMLGHTVMKYLARQNHTVKIVKGRWPDDNFLTEIINMNVDYVINCIGAIPQRTKDFDINYELPIWLDKNLECKVINPGTDCEMDNDHYGVSKVNASDYIKRDGKRTKIIKTSIIGHELNSSHGLLEWFLGSEGKVYGYNKFYWNGNTTLEWAIVCEDLMMKWDRYEVEHIITSDCISKYQLLKKISKIYGKQILISKQSDVEANKCLTGEMRESIDIQLQELKDFYDN